MKEHVVERFRDLRPGDILVGWGHRFLVIDVRLGYECLDVEWFNLDTRVRHVVGFDPRHYVWDRGEVYGQNSFGDGDT